MQRQMIQEIEEKPPALIVHAMTLGSWGKYDSETLITLMEWFSDFTAKNYHIVKTYPVGNTLSEESDKKRQQVYNLKKKMKVAVSYIDHE